MISSNRGLSWLYSDWGAWAVNVTRVAPAAPGRVAIEKMVRKCVYEMCANDSKVWAQHSNASWWNTRQTRNRNVPVVDRVSLPHSRKSSYSFCFPPLAFCFHCLLQQDSPLEVSLSLPPVIWMRANAKESRSVSVECFTIGRTEWSSNSLHRQNQTTRGR